MRQAMSEAEIAEQMVHAQAIHDWMATHPTGKRGAWAAFKAFIDDRIDQAALDTPEGLNHVLTTLPRGCEAWIEFPDDIYDYPGQKALCEPTGALCGATPACATPHGYYCREHGADTAAVTPR